jgi:hypothetical protein
MKLSAIILVVFALSFALMGFSDFLDYWVVKVNGKEVYNSNDDKKYNKSFSYEVIKSSLTIQDSLEVEYFTDTPCECIYNYFVTEYSEENGASGTFLKEQKTFLPKSFKVSLLDLSRLGNQGSVKGIYYYRQDHPFPKELCQIKFR